MKLFFVRFLQAWLLCTSHGHPAADDDLFLLPNSELNPSILAQDTGDGLEPLAGPDFLALADEDSVSMFLPSSGFDPGSNLFDPSIGESLSLDEIAVTPGDWNVADDSNYDLMDLVANSHPNCVSDEGPFFGGIGRRSDTCVDPTRFQDPSAEVANPPDNENKEFPPPGSTKSVFLVLETTPNLDRRVKSRTPRSISSIVGLALRVGVNTLCVIPVSTMIELRCDTAPLFMPCSIVQAVSRHLYSLGQEFWLNHPRTVTVSNFFECFKPHQRWCCQYYMPNGFGLGNDGANYCIHQGIDEFQF